MNNNKFTLPLEDLGLFIGFVTLPYSDQYNFYEQEFENGLFKNYREGQKEYLNDVKDFSKHLFQPRSYYMYGKYDLAILSLVDNFQFSSRAFHSYSPFVKDKSERNERNFHHQIITCLSSILQEKENFLDNVSRIFNENHLPLIAISKLKLNNFLLLGTGISFLNSTLLYIDGIIQELNKRIEGENEKNKFNKKRTDYKIQYLILESYSWHEITLILLSDDIIKIRDIILDVRETNFEEFCGSPYIKNLEIKEEIEKKSLKSSRMNNIKNINYCHIFEKTISYIGFDFEIFKEIQSGNENIYNKINKDSIKELKLFCRWFTKPGHIKETVNLTNTEKILKEITLCFGEGDIVQSDNLDGETNIINYFPSVFNKKKTNRSIENHIEQSYSIPYITKKADEIKNNYKDVNLLSNKELNYLIIKPDDIYRFLSNLRKLGVQNITKEKFANIFAKYNDGVLDNVLFPFFFELQPFLISIIDQVDNYIKDKSTSTELKILIPFLEEFTIKFECAYRNRFLLSHRMSDYTDTIIEYKGGINQLVSVFNSIYKSITKIMGYYNSFVYVAGNPDIFSNHYSIQLNYYHIFQPSLFLSTMLHEAANFYFLPDNLQSKSKPTFAIISNLYNNSENKSNLLLNFIHEKYTNSEWSYLLDYIDQNFINYIFTDFLNYKFIYNSNIKLFKYWYYNYFFQLRQAYTNFNVINERNFIAFVLRILTILRIDGKKDIICLQCNNKKINKTLSHLYDELNPFLDSLFESEFFSIWKNDISKYVTDLYDQSIENQTLNNSQISKNFADIILDIKNSFQEGIPIIYDDREDNNPFWFVQILSYAYLDLLKDNSNGEINLLRRDSLEAFPLLDNKDTSKYKFDPQGGIFTTNSKFRRDYFRYRTTLIKSFWDMSCKIKKHDILEQLNKFSKK